VLQATSFGVVCNNSHDDGPALNNFFAAVTNTAGVLPPGTCLSSVALILPNSLFDVGGAGPYATTLEYTGSSTTANIVTVAGSSNVAVAGPGKLHDLRIMSSTRMTAGEGLHVMDVGRVILKDVILDGQNGNGNLYNAIWFDQTDFIRLEGFEARGQNDCLLVSADGIGNGVQYDLFAQNGKVAGCGHAGVHLAGGFDNAHFDNMELTANAKDVIIDNAVNAGKNQEVIFGPHFVTDNSSGGDDFYINDTSTNCANYCQIAIQGKITGAQANGINVHAYPNGYVTISSPWIIGNGAAGINVDDASTTITVAPETILDTNATWGIYASVATSKVVYGGTARNNTSGSYSSNITLQTH